MSASARFLLLRRRAAAYGPERYSQAGDGTADKDNWTPGDGATLSNPSVGILRVTNTTANGHAKQVVISNGVLYRYAFETRSDGNATPRFLFGSLNINGTTSTGWQAHSGEFVADNEITPRCLSITATPGEYTEWRKLSVREVL